MTALNGQTRHPSAHSQALASMTQLIHDSDTREFSCHYAKRSSDPLLEDLCWLRRKQGCYLVPQVVTYLVDESTTVGFEIEPMPGFRPADADKIAGRVRDAVGPAVEAAKVVLDKVKESCPDEIEVKLESRSPAAANWLIAKAATEGSFEITLSWTPGTRERGASATKNTSAALTAEDDMSAATGEAEKSHAG